MAERLKTCGSCTLCCKVMAVSELSKPGGTLCVHARPGKGCGIYETRPQGCRAFACVWLMDREMPHRFRPDQTKVVLDMDHEGRRLIARCDPANPLAWRRNPMHAALKGYAQDHWGTGKVVMAVAGRRAWVITPKADIDLGEIDPAARIEVIEAADGTVSVRTS
ncbi:YkgJ family cysteine cluster protein [Phenylobacterium sp.]|uniref:YkgJ family cysteine cluster protein n=1 Tax=Phenylobacterium sp. TaxID=1871053 RepID=UPI0035B1802A